MIFFLAPLAGLALVPALRWALGLNRPEDLRLCYRRATALLSALGLVAPVLLVLAHPQRLIDWQPGLGPALGALSAAVTGAASLATSARIITVLSVVIVLALLFAPLAEVLLERRAKRVPAAGDGWLGGGRLAAPAAFASASLLVGTIVAGALSASLDRSSGVLAIYPDLTDAVGAIQEQTADVRTVLVDDSAVRYYLYPRIPTDRVTDPFEVTYRGQQGIDGYRLAIGDRYYDAIILDGGIGPLGKRIRQDLGGDIAQNYALVYAAEAPNTRTPIEIYRPREAVAEAPAESEPQAYDFGAGVHDWGGQPDTGKLQPGLDVAISPERDWNGHPSPDLYLAQVTIVP